MKAGDMFETIVNHQLAHDIILKYVMCRQGAGLWLAAPKQSI